MRACGRLVAEDQRAAGEVGVETAAARNVVEFGRNVYGAEAAARYYFSKAAASLDPLESATLAALFVMGVRTESLGLLAVAAVGTLQSVPRAVVFFFGEDVRIAAPLALLAVAGILVTVAVTVVRRRDRARRRSTPQ